jgi:cell division protein FtsB
MKFKRSKLFTIAVIGVAVILLANSGARKVYQRYWELKNLSAELEQSKKENALLRKEIYFLENDPSYIEKMARRELGLVSHGEIEYRFKK